MNLKDFLPLPKGQEPVDAKDFPDIINLVLTDLRGTLPPKAFSVVDEYKSQIDKSSHLVECQLAIEAKKGKAEACARGKREREYQERLQANRFKNRPKQLKNRGRFAPFKKGTATFGAKIAQGGDYFGANQNNVRFNVPRSNNESEFKPDNADSTLGNRAVLFDANGRVIRTANEIARDGKQIDESAKTASDRRVPTLLQKQRPATEIKSLKDLLNKTKGHGEINSLAGLFAAVTGLLAIAALLVVLVPASFITVALNWLQTITTMIASVRDLTTTYLSMTDAGLSLFGYPKTTDKLKGVVNGIAYGIFGKENYEAAKAAFARGILNLTSMTKMLEKVEQFKNGTNNRIESIRLGLGVTNNGLKDAGLIPPDSPWMEYSEKVDKFVATGTAEEKENIQKLTEEIQTQEEINKEIAEEKEARDKVKAAKAKELDNLKTLGQDIKPILDKQIADAKE